MVLLPSTTVSFHPFPNWSGPMLTETIGNDFMVRTVQFLLPFAISLLTHPSQIDNLGFGREERRKLNDEVLEERMGFR